VSAEVGDGGPADTPATGDEPDLSVLTDPVDPRAPATAGDGRRAVREARRQRRRTTWLCAAVVALCLALTIVVVLLARDRPLGTPGVVGADAVSVSASVSASPAPAGAGTVPEPVPNRGATASEGGNP
jgi:hypothetical protein